MTVLKAARFRTIRRLLATRWQVEGEGGFVGYALDLMRDAFVERVRQGHLARFPEDPSGTPAPEDRLAAIGRARRKFRGIGESAASYAQRLIRHLDDAEFRGNPFGLLDELGAYLGASTFGVKLRVVDASGNWHTRDSDGTRSYSWKRANWNWDGLPIGNRWSRFWLVIYPGTLWTAGTDTWGTAAAWGTLPNRVWGLSATPDQVQTVRAIVADWKRLGTKCVNIIVAFDASDFDPASNLGSPGLPDGNYKRWSKNVAGVQVPARMADARYLDGV